MTKLLKNVASQPQYLYDLVEDRGDVSLVIVDADKPKEVAFWVLTIEAEGHIIIHNSVSPAAAAALGLKLDDDGAAVVAWS
jgi:hypothetical protein